MSKVVRFRSLHCEMLRDSKIFSIFEQHNALVSAPMLRLINVAVVPVAAFCMTGSTLQCNSDRGSLDLGCQIGFPAVSVRYAFVLLILSSAL